MKSTGSVVTKIALAATLAATSLPAAGLAFADEGTEAQGAVAEAQLSGSYYPDVDDDAWYANAIRNFSLDGIMTGYDNGLFGVGDIMTRGQLATTLWRCACPKEANSYDAANAVNTSGIADVADGTYYTAAANWAASNGIINGFDEGGHREFRPDAPVTMEQLCCIMANYTGASYHIDIDDRDDLYYKNILAYGYADISNGFEDYNNVSDWAVKSVGWCAKRNWVHGYDNEDGTHSLRPGEALTRERAATLLHNMCLTVKRDQSGPHIVIGE